MNFNRILHNLNRMFKWINNLFNGRSRTFAVVGRALMATVMGLLLSLCLVDAFTLSTTAMFSAPEKRDFQMSDMFAQIADNRPVRKFDDRIVIVNIGRGDRQDIAEGLSLLSLCGPKAVGVDINFAEPRGEDDQFLIDALNSNDFVVMPLGVTALKENGIFKVTEKPFFYDECPRLHYGVVNLPMNSAKGTVREYAVDFKTDEGVIPSFVAMLAESMDPSAVKKLKERKSETGVTEFHSREYLTVNLDEIEEHAEDFADKIVMIGALEDSSDMHATPVKSYVAGIMLHAYALSTVLDGIWYKKLPKMLDYIIAIGLCLGLMLFSYGFKNNLKGIFLRFIQGILCFLAVRIGYALFVDHNIIIDISFTLMIIAFGFLAADIWNGVETLWNMGCKKIDKLDMKLNSAS